MLVDFLIALNYGSFPNPPPSRWWWPYASSASKELFTLCSFFAELQVHDYNCLKFSPKNRAAATMYLTFILLRDIIEVERRHHLGVDEWEFLTVYE